LTLNSKGSTKDTNSFSGNVYMGKKDVNKIWPYLYWFFIVNENVYCFKGKRSISLCCYGFSGPQGSWIVCCLLKKAFRSCPMWRQWCDYHWRKASIKPRLLFFPCRLCLFRDFPFLSRNHIGNYKRYKTTNKHDYF